MSNERIFIHQLIRSWDYQVAKTGKLLKELTDEQLLTEIAPGRNRGIYVMGHLIAIHDAMPEILGLGKRQYPDLHAIFVQNPDKFGMDTPDLSTLRMLWDNVHLRLTELLPQISLEDWLDRHHAITPEQFVKDPNRNKISVMLGRTNHLSYHFGQLKLIS